MNSDKYKDNGILQEIGRDVEYYREVMKMVGSNPELLNSIYKEISEHLGMETTLEIYGMFKGQQISFPVRFFSPAVIRKKIVEEYDGTNIRALAVKYDYSEKTVRRIIKESLE